MTLAGNHVRDESINSLIHIISATPELQTYAIYKLFFSLRENITQDGLAKVGLWCIGEYSTILISGSTTGPDNTPITVTQEDIVDLFDKVLSRHNLSEQVKEYALTALIKLYTKFSFKKDKIRELIDSQTTSPSLEVQQRACEYLQLLDQEFDTIRTAIVDTIPPLEVESLQKPIGDATTLEVPHHRGTGAEETAKSSHVGGLMDDDIFGIGAAPTATTNTTNTTGASTNLGLLDDIFSPTPQVQQTQQPQAPSLGSKVRNFKCYMMLKIYLGYFESLWKHPTSSPTLRNEPIWHESAIRRNGRHGRYGRNGHWLWCRTFWTTELTRL